MKIWHKPILRFVKFSQTQGHGTGTAEDEQGGGFMS